MIRSTGTTLQRTTAFRRSLPASVSAVQITQSTDSPSRYDTRNNSSLSGRSLTGLCSTAFRAPAAALPPAPRTATTVPQSLGRDSHWRAGSSRRSFGSKSFDNKNASLTSAKADNRKASTTEKPNSAAQSSTPESPEQPRSDASAVDPDPALNTTIDSSNTEQTTEASKSKEPEQPSEWNRYVYVHPLSGLILEHLQDYHHDFLDFHGLTLLRLHRDGSFELLQEDPVSRQHSAADEAGPTSAHGVDNDEKAELEVDAIDYDSDNNLDTDSPSSTSNVQQKPPMYGPIRIWTSYDEMEKKHWLTVQHVEKEYDMVLQDQQNDERKRGRADYDIRQKPLYKRFLLQDNMLPAWHGNAQRTSLPTRIHESVNQLIGVIRSMG